MATRLEQRVQTLTASSSVRELRLLATDPPPQDDDEGVSATISSDGPPQLNHRRSDELLRHQEVLNAAEDSTAKNAMVSLANNLAAIGKPTEAIRIMERVVEMEEKRWGKDSPMLAPYLMDMANFLSVGGRPYDSSAFSSRAAVLLRK